MGVNFIILIVLLIFPCIFIFIESKTDKRKFTINGKKYDSTSLSYAFYKIDSNYFSSPYKEDIIKTFNSIAGESFSLGDYNKLSKNLKLDIMNFIDYLILYRENTDFNDNEAKILNNIVFRVNQELEIQHNILNRKLDVEREKYLSKKFNHIK